MPFFPISRIVQWSQAAFAEWEYLAGSRDVDTSSLSYIIRSWVTNTETQDQVVEALRGVGRTSIPGIASRQVFRRTSTNQAEVDGFYAMLGTPNGASTGFLVATHIRESLVSNGSQVLPFGITLYRMLISTVGETVGSSICCLRWSLWPIPRQATLRKCEHYFLYVPIVRVSKVRRSSDRRGLGLLGGMEGSIGTINVQYVTLDQGQF